MFFTVVGYFMCSSCKKMGQWDMLQSFLTTTKGTKKWKLPPNLQENTEIEHLKETLINVINTTTQLSSLMENDLKEVLGKFQLPVCIIPKYCQENINMIISFNVRRLPKLIYKES